MNPQYTSTLGKDGRLYIFKVNENGHKVRTTNDNVRYCQGQIPT